jgi:hypothetical protein
MRAAFAEGTFPARGPGASRPNMQIPLPLHESAGIHGDRLPGNGPALIAGKEEGEIGDIISGRDVAERHAPQKPLPVCFVLHPLLVGHPAHPVAPQFGVDGSRNDTVAADAVLADVESDDFCESAQRCFGGYVDEKLRITPARRSSIDCLRTSRVHSMAAVTSMAIVAFQFSRVCSQM